MPDPNDDPESSREIIREFNDRGTLWLLEDPENARGLLQILEPSLAETLDFGRAERINRSFIPADLHKQESDLIFRVPFVTGADDTAEVWVYVLLEHQSRPDPEMALRVLSYMLQLWEAQRREWQDAHRSAEQRRLPPVVPIVFYTGEDAWNSPIQLLQMMDAPDALARFVPQWETLFLNLRRTSPEALTQMGTAVGWALRVLQAEQEPLAALERVLSEAMQQLETLSEDLQGQWLRVMWYFLLLSFHRRPREEYAILSEEIKQQASASKFRVREEINVMSQTMAEYVQEQAAERASKQATRNTLRMVLAARFGKIPTDVEAAIEKADVETMNAWAQTAATAQTLDEVGILSNGRY